MSRSGPNRLALLVIVGAVITSACGGGDAEQPGGDAPQETAAADDAAATGDAAGGDEPLAQLAEAAAGEGPVIWYESTPTEQMQPVLDAFNQRFPESEVEHVRIEAGREVGARIVQESQAGAETADIGTSGADVILELQDRDLLAELDAAELQVSQEVLPAPYYALATAVSTYVGLYNTDEVAEGDAPASWEELVDPRWQGSFATWSVPAAQAHLAQEWGEERVREYVQQMAALQPRLYASTFPLASDVGSGQVPVALGIYHSAQPPIEAGAPIGVALLEPTSVSTIYTGLVADSPNANAAKLFAAWLHTDEGAQAYEAATGRGSQYLDTETAALLEGRTIAEWPLEETPTLRELTEEFTAILESSGTPVEAAS